MKKYSNIPLKERKINADRCYRHEARLEEIEMRKLIKLKKHNKTDKTQTDKEQQEAEAFARLKSFEKGGE